ncbi:mannitol-1-phosphate 5-dehydrogenase [Treponema sp. OttesenSCG-928-L16]|nr:mannitol-1-phosphate 5-dehydrogenase [Treponema sp. OttesenSCG-928-L16]
MKLIQIGAGNIGRSFIGQLFSRSGWEVVFIDVNSRLVSLLNERRYYPVVIKREGMADEKRLIGPVRAVDGSDAEAAAGEIAGADILAVSVGKPALTAIFPVIAEGLRRRCVPQRHEALPAKPLNIIIAENIRGAKALFRTALSKELGPGCPLKDLAGLVETSIGKMVPIMRAEDLAADPLQLFAEEYETLIVDRKGFIGELPKINGLWAVENIEAYVDRKLFIHNLGHAAAAYLGCKADPSKPLIAEVMAVPELERAVRKAMNEAADALAAEYPDAYGRDDLAEHIDDLVKRFANRALGDTVYRVGRDLSRKLGRDDRITGAMLLCAKRGLPFSGIAEVYRAAFDFTAQDEGGRQFPADVQFFQHTAALAGEDLFKTISGLDGSRRTDRAVLEELHRLFD